MAIPSFIDPICAGIVAILWSAAASITGASVAGFKPPEGEASREYCHFETFRADCPAGEVILMERAFYGRKSLGRCVRTNFGFIGCYSNVLEYMDRLCSGRRSCDVAVIEPNFEDIRPCNVELKSYLEAEYVCLPVADAVLDSCEVVIVQRRPTVLPRIGAFACGTEASPWVMKVPAGQRINITLFEFSAAAAASVASVSAVGAGPSQRPPPLVSAVAASGELWVERQATKPCRSYGRLWEQTAPPSSLPSSGSATIPLDICAGSMTNRESHIHTTLTSSVDVVLTGQSRHGYLLVFSVVGCPDVHTPVDMMSQYSADRSTAKVTCRDSDQSWRLVCSERGWHGYVGNCSTKLAKTQATSVEPFSHLKTSTAVVAAIVVGVSLTISFFILTIGLFILKKIRGSSSSSGYNDHIVMTCPVTASAAAAASSSASGERSSPHLSSSSECFDFRYHRPHHHHHHPQPHHHHRQPRSRLGRPLIASASSPFADCVPFPYPSSSSSPPTSDDCPLTLLTVSHGPRRQSVERDLAASLCRRLSFSSTAGVEASGLPSKSAQYGDCSCSDVETELLVRADRNCPDCVPCTGKGSKSSSGFPI